MKKKTKYYGLLTEDAEYDEVNQEVILSIDVEIDPPESTATEYDDYNYWSDNDTARWDLEECKLWGLGNLGRRIVDKFTELNIFNDEVTGEPIDYDIELIDWDMYKNDREKGFLEFRFSTFSATISTEEISKGLAHTVDNIEKIIEEPVDSIIDGTIQLYPDSSSVEIKENNVKSEDKSDVEVEEESDVDDTVTESFVTHFGDTERIDKVRHSHRRRFNENFGVISNSRYLTEKTHPSNLNLTPGQFTAQEIIDIAKNSGHRKGTFYYLTIMSPGFSKNLTDSGKASGKEFTKVEVIQALLGVKYEDRQVVKDDRAKKGIGPGNPAGGKSWHEYDTDFDGSRVQIDRKKSDHSAKYVCIAPAGNHITVHYFIDGREISREDLKQTGYVKPEYWVKKPSAGLTTKNGLPVWLTIHVENVLEFMGTHK